MCSIAGQLANEEMQFFYPSTEWDMAQPFECICAAPTCRGTISGARDMTSEQLDGLWLNNHIRELLDEQAQKGTNKAEAEAIGTQLQKKVAAA